MLSSPSLTADLKLRIPSPRPLPRSANLLGPKIKRATASNKRISGTPNLPGICLISPEGQARNQRRPSLAEILGYWRAVVKELDGSQIFEQIGLNCLNEAGHEGGTTGQLGKGDEFVWRMGAVANRPQPVESRYPKSCREVTVRTAADGSLFQFPTELFGNLGSLLVKPDDAGGTLHRRAVDTSLNFQVALAVETFHFAKTLIQDSGVFHGGYADIERGGSLGGNDIDAGPSLNQPHVDGQSPLEISELGDGRDLAGKFEDGALTFLEVESGVSGFAGDLHGVFSNAFARGLHRATRSERWFEDQYCLGVPGDTFGDAPG